MHWRLGRPDPQSTDIVVRFVPLDEARCRVTLTHEKWERMGAEGEALRNSYNSGWDAVLIAGFGARAGLV
jgi:hypothetical protein